MRTILKPPAIAVTWVAALTFAIATFYGLLADSILVQIVAGVAALVLLGMGIAEIRREHDTG